MPNIERLKAWRVVDSRGLGAHSTWSWGTPPVDFAADEIETVEFVRADAYEGAVATLEKIDALIEADMPTGRFRVRLEEIVAHALAIARGR